MKVIFIIGFLSIFSLGVNSLDDQVYICNSTGAKKYHYKKNCRGLSNCKKEVKEISLEAAKDRGRTLCGWED
jgi:hypothetical protein